MDAVIEYLRWLDQNPRQNALYRGHANLNWLITPSAFRPNANAIRNKDQLARWRQAAARFASPKPQSDMEWLVLAQHYGIATGLLDWTTNPLIGLFFASQFAGSGVDGCVIQCDRSLFDPMLKPESVEVFKANRERPPLIDASAMNARTLAQDSVMSLHYGSFPTFGFAGAGETFVIKLEAKPAIVMALRKFGFSTERLYSDLTTAAQQFQHSLAMDTIMEIARQAEAAPKRA